MASSSALEIMEIICMLPLREKRRWNESTACVVADRPPWQMFASTILLTLFLSRKQWRIGRIRLAIAMETCVTCCLLCPIARSSNVLYTTSASWLRVVNQSNGSTVWPGKSCNCSESTEAIAWRPGDSGHLYGVINSRVASARLARIDVRTGHYDLYPIFDSSSLGMSKAFADGIAVSSANPDVAVVTGFDSDVTSSTYAEHFVWTIDLNGGSVLTSGVLMSAKVGVITFTLDGTRVFGADENGRLVTLDPDTGMSQVIGDPGLSDYIEGLSFRPSDGMLFAIDGYTADNLVILDPLNGSLVATLGSLHVGGAHGLAFLVPEPATVFLLAAAAVSALFVPGRRNRDRI